uniref:Uncharacterized protein n=1 Tax=Caenorhabditis japonica TaxID=281687 RepID=A0A8R1I0R3_CAEJA
MRIFSLLFLIIGQVSCSGHLQIRLKSQYRQNLSITVAQQLNPFFISLPIRLAAEEEKLLGSFPIDFDKNYTLTIIGGKTEQLGINESSYRAEFEPIQVRLAPKQLHLPLTGLELVFSCDKNWSGPKCDIESEYIPASTSLKSLKTLEVQTDYTIDLDKLPTIIKKIKETTKVDNEIRNSLNDDNSKEVEKEILIEKIDTETTQTTKKPRKETPRKSIFSELFKTIFSLQEDLLSETEMAPRRAPIVVDVEMNDRNFELETPFSFPSQSSFMQSYRNRMVEKRKEEERKRKEGVEKHREMQQMLGMRHTTPRVLDARPAMDRSDYSSPEPIITWLTRDLEDQLDR